MQPYLKVKSSMCETTIEEAVQLILGLVKHLSAFG